MIVQTGSRIDIDDDALKVVEANLLDFDQDATPPPPPPPLAYTTTTTATAAKPASKVQASLIDLDDEDSELEYTHASSSNSKTVKEIAGNFSKGGSLKPVGDHRGSSFSHIPSGTTPSKTAPNEAVVADTSMDEVFENSASSVNDIDLLMHDDKDDAKPSAEKKDNDFDTYLDSIGTPSSTGK